MAAAYEALVSLMNTIEQIKNHALISTFFDEERLESVGQRVEFLLDFIENINSSHGGNDGLEKRIASAAYEAEGVIESHIADQIRADERRSSIFLVDLQRIAEEMDCIKEETIMVKEERRSEDEQQPAFSIPAAATSWRAHQTRMVGFDEEFRQLMHALTREESSRQIISVVGMGGTGKSTLVRNVYANFIIVRRFDVCAWASVTQEYSVRGILIELLVSFKQKPTSESVQQLGEMLHKFLFGRRYLIILDDVWSVEVWDEIQLYFPENNDYSRIVLTTRLVDVAKHCNSYHFSMYLLDEDRSWILFCETVFGCEDCPPELEEVGKEISQQCKGLPLSIVVVGGFLRRSNKTVESWNNVAKNVNSVVMSSDEDDHDCYKILSLSYSQLDVHLKPCFVCMSDFQAGFGIRASQIIKLWVAKGLIKPNRAQTLEGIAEGYLYKLVDRNLILAYKNLNDGKIMFFVHDLIREVYLSEYEEDMFYWVGRGLCIETDPPNMFFVHDLIKEDKFYCVGRGLCRETDPPNMFFVHDLIREVYLSEYEADMFYCVETDPPIIYHESMLSENITYKIFVQLDRFRIPIIGFIGRPLLWRALPLRVVLGLMRVFSMVDSSLESISNNSNAKLLFYRLSDIYKPIVLIPSSVSLKIWNLQTLYIRSDYHKLDRQFLVVAPLDRQFLVVAPLEIWNLQQLRHVVCARIYIPDPPPNIVLENLQTLTTVVNLMLSEDICRRIPNVNKLYVEYNSDAPGFGYRWPNHLHNVGSLHKLRSLKLSLYTNTFLNRLSLRAGWRKCTFPTSLKKLKLKNCHIDWNDLSRISSLPHLEVLKLHNSAKGRNWSPADGEFRALKVLSIDDCDLRWWNANSSHFPVLKALFLARLSHLEEIPLEIGEIPTLELIEVYKCSKSAHISAEKIKNEQVELGNEGLRILLSTPLSPIRTFWFAYYRFLFDYGI